MISNNSSWIYFTILNLAHKNETCAETVDGLGCPGQIKQFEWTWTRLRLHRLLIGMYKQAEEALQREWSQGSQYLWRDSHTEVGIFRTRLCDGLVSMPINALWICLALIRPMKLLWYQTHCGLLCESITNRQLNCWSVVVNCKTLKFRCESKMARCFGDFTPLVECSRWIHGRCDCGY